MIAGMTVVTVVTVVTVIAGMTAVMLIAEMTTKLVLLCALILCHAGSDLSRHPTLLQGKIKPRTLIFFGFGPDLATVFFDNAFYGREANAGASEVVAAV